MEKNKNMFSILNSINVNEHVEKKDGLSYLTWSWAWATLKEIYPDATYEIVKFDGKPYYEDSCGAMCYTSITANGLTHEMWLPVMDGKNKAMKREPYKYTTKYGEKTVDAFSMFDVNKTLMRCLVKNLAMFGLGLYIYSGEDLPAPVAEEIVYLTQDQVLDIEKLLAETNTDRNKFIAFMKASSIETINYDKAIRSLNNKKQKMTEASDATV